MGKYIFCTAGNTPALTFAEKALRNMGHTFVSQPDETVTHLLLPVPSFSPDGCIKGGGQLADIFAKLGKDTVIIGGNLPEAPGYRVCDLLKDPTYIAENAYITAHCAVRMVMDRLPVALRGCKILVIGWGRIGKCLAALLKGLEANVTVAARKESDRAILSALGYRTADPNHLPEAEYRVIFNTAPAMILPSSPPGCLKIDLASVPGMGGNDVIHALGLPGKDAPEASGALIARTVCRLIMKEEYM